MDIVQRVGGSAANPYFVKQIFCSTDMSKGRISPIHCFWTQVTWGSIHGEQFILKILVFGQCYLQKPKICSAIFKNIN